MAAATPDSTSATAGDPGLLQQAVTLHRQGRLAAAEALYQQISRLQPGQFDALHLRGVIALQTRRTALGVALIRHAIALDATVAAAHNNLGNGLLVQRQYDEALASFDRAIALQPDDAELHCNRATALQNLGRYQEVVESCERALALQPDFAFLPGMLAHARMTVCNWSHLARDRAALAAAIARGEPAAMPFPAVVLTDSPALQRTAAEIYVRRKVPADAALPPILSRPRHDRLRIGYFSADFHNHATAYLMAELFERHDASAFEITAFSFGADTGDAMRQRLMARFDRFIDVQEQSDRDVALLVRQLEIDIAVDLKGFTKGFRTGIFACRAAPIQVNYLGYPGTMGAGYIDYIIADRILIPEQDQLHYAEKIAWLPDCYQVNDTRRQIADAAPTRAEAGLPPHGFVFCCFNNSYKITPDVFDCWMRLLRQVAGSVLWLLLDNATATANLCAAAAQHGIDPDRLVFAPRQPLPEHLARHRLADLFLDTAPYNAHTTASDALWSGLPVLTRIGATFAGRVATSLLHAVGLPELVAATAENYEATALALANDADALAAIRRRLARQCSTAPLFDTARFARHLEAAYQAMQARYQAGLPPDHIHVAPIAMPPQPEASPTESEQLQPEALRELLLRGVALHRQGDLTAAARIYEDVLQRDAQHFDALHLRGVVALQSRHTEEGIAWVRRAIAVNPDVAEAHNNLGNALRELQRYQEALACFDRALALQPDFAAAESNRSMTLRRIEADAG